MWFDVLKNQISVGRQKLRSSKKPLPEEEDEDCKTKFKDMTVQMTNSAAMTGTYGSSLMKVIDEIPDRFFCEAIEQLVSFVDEYKTSQDIPFSEVGAGDYSSGIYAREFFKITYDKSTINRGLLVVRKYHPQHYGWGDDVKINKNKIVIEFTIKLYMQAEVSLNVRLEGSKDFFKEEDVDPEEELEDNYQELRTIIMRFS